MKSSKKRRILIEDFGRPCRKCGCLSRLISAGKNDPRCPNCLAAYQSSIKDSLRETQRIWRIANPAKLKLAQERAAAHRKTPDGKMAVMIRSARQRAKSNGWCFNLSHGDLVYVDVCPLLGVPINWSANVCSPESPTLDRIDSKKGYTKDNVWVVSHKANSIKNSTTYEDFQTIYKNWSKLY